MSNTRMEWTKPQLIVLARGAPEETLTLDCKAIGPGFDGPEGFLQNGCNDPDVANCGSCQARNNNS